MDRLLDSPWFLRFTALFLAILLFYTVKADEEKLRINSSSESIEVIRDVPVEVYYDNENLIVTGVPETVNVTVEGSVNIVQTTKLLKDFTLYVDLSSHTMGEHQVRIQHENLSDKLIVRIDPATVDVVIEEKITETFRIEPEFNQRLLAEGFNVVNMDVEPSTIDVTGAKSVIEAISFVKATVAVDEGAHESFEQEARVRVLDRDLNKLDVAITPENVTVKVDIQENTKEVPIVLNEKGTPPEGVTINSITSEVEKIVISGPNRILNEIEAFPVDVDVSKVEKSGTIEVKLKKPDDIFKLSQTTIKVKVDATIEQADEEEEVVEEVPTIDTTQVENVQIVVTGLNEKFKGTLVEPANGLVTLTVKATPDVISSLKQSDFTVSIDASTASEEGEEVYPILVKGPPNTEWTISASEATLKIELA